VVVAVHLSDDGDTGQWWRFPAGSALREQLGEGDGLATQPLDVEIAPEQLDGVGAEYGRAAGLHPHDETARAQMLRQRGDGALQDLLRGGELSGRDPGEPAAHRFGRHGDGPTAAPGRAEPVHELIHWKVVADDSQPAAPDFGELPGQRSPLPDVSLP
jgi:hypothetical protein